MTELISLSAEEVDLAERFYRELMVPSLTDQDWGHFIGAFQSTESSRLQLILAVTYHTERSSSPQPHAVKQLKGGIAFQHFEQSNVGFVRMILLHPQHVDSDLGKQLLYQALEALDQCAAEGGDIAGTNAIFSETKLVPEESIEGTLYSEHGLLCQLGFWRVDFDYFSPAYNEPAVLTVLVNERVPRDVFSNDPYILSRTGLELFEEIFSAEEQEKATFVRMRDAMILRERLPLLEGEWGRLSEAFIVDLHDDFDEELLCRFHSQYLAPNYDDVYDYEPLDALRAMIQSEATLSAHLLLALSRSQVDVSASSVSNAEAQAVSRPKILGGCCVEYSNDVGVITHIILRADHPEDLDKDLVTLVAKKLDEKSKRKGTLSGGNALFAEVFLLPDMESTQRETIDISRDHHRLHALGFRMVGCEYVFVPPTSAAKHVSQKFALTAYLNNCVPKLSWAEGSCPYMPAGLIRNIINFQLTIMRSLEYPDNQMLCDFDFVKAIAQLYMVDTVPLLELPWNRDRMAIIQEIGPEGAVSHACATLYCNMLQELTTGQRSPAPPKLCDDLRQLCARHTASPNTAHVVLAVSIASTATHIVGDILEAKKKEQEEQPPRRVDEHEDFGKSDECDRDLYVSAAVSSLELHAGVSFEYLAGSNVGVITSLVVASELCHLDFIQLVVKHAKRVLDKNARQNNNVGGCPVVLFETCVESVPVNRKNRFVDLLSDHAMLEQLGLQMLDTSAFHAPFAHWGLFPGRKLRDVYYAVAVSDSLPRDQFDPENRYLPQSVVVALLREYYETSLKKGLLSVAEHTRIISKLHRLRLTTQLPLRLPTCSPPAWFTVDITQNFDEALFVRFFNELMVPNFPIEDELTPLDDFIASLSCKDPRRSRICKAILVLQWDTNGRLIIGGGITAEYYVRSNCSLLTYLVVDSKVRGAGLAKLLLQAAIRVMDCTASISGYLSGCNANFLETNKFDSEVAAMDVIDPRVRHTIYQRMGFRLLDFDYVMPPLAPHMSKVLFLHLLVFLTPRIPKSTLGPSCDNQHFIPAITLRNFMLDLWKVSYESEQMGPEYVDDVDYKASILQLETVDRVWCLNLPWTSSPWVFVDMREEFDEELLTCFYEKFLLPLGNKVEPLESLLAACDPQQTDSDSKRQLRIILGLCVPTGGKNVARIVVGGIVCEYYDYSNCGIVTHFPAPDPMAEESNNEPEEGQAPPPSFCEVLVNHMISHVHRGARNSGNICGANAIFMQCSPQLLEFESLEGDPRNHAFLFKMGFRALCMPYWPPPCSLTSAGKRDSITLAVLLTDRIPKVETPVDGDSEARCLPSTLVRNFVEEQWTQHCLLTRYNYRHDQYYLSMIDMFDTAEEILLSSNPPPWIQATKPTVVSSRLMTLVDSPSLGPSATDLFTSVQELDLFVEALEKQLAKARACRAGLLKQQGVSPTSPPPSI